MKKFVTLVLILSLGLFTVVGCGAKEKKATRRPAGSREGQAQDALSVPARNGGNPVGRRLQS